MIAEANTSPKTAGMSAAKRALLERRLSGASAGVPKPQPVIPRRPAGATAPLSYAQQRLWFLAQLEPESPLYNMPLALRLDGMLDQEAVRKALTAIVARHEGLRTRYEPRDGGVVQVTGEAVPVDLAFCDVSDVPESDREAEMRDLISQEARKPFDLTRDLMLRALLVQLSDLKHVLLLSMHHIASDGWSWGVFFREFTALYEGFSAGQTVTLPELPIQYADYAVWHREWMERDGSRKQLDYWKHQLAGAPDFLELPADHPRPAVQSYHGAAERMLLPADLSEGLKELSRREGVTLFMLLLAAFNVLLKRYTRQTDLVVGTPIAGRTQLETENLIGFFINTLVLRSDLSGNPTFREVLARVKRVTMDAYAHQDLPFDKLVEELKPRRSAGYQPLVQVMFVLQNTPTSGGKLRDLNVTPLDIDTATAKFDWTFMLEERDGGLGVILEYNTDLFEAETVRRVLKNWGTLLGGIVSDPEGKIAALPLLSEDERKLVLQDWSGGRTEYPRDRTVAELFEEQAANSPGTVALEFENRTLTYGELNAQAQVLAARLTACGVGPGVMVAISLERSLELIISLVAILKAGGAYVSLDPQYPKERLELMLRDTKPPVLITQKKFRETWLALGANVLCVDEAQPDTSALSSVQKTKSFGEAGPESPVYVSYTSGSTGIPKGVCVPNRAVVRLVKNTNYASFEASEVFLQLAPVAFDASTLEIWGPLLNGGRLVIFPAHAPTLSELGEFIQKRKITTLWLTAGLFHQMIEEQPGAFAGVRQLLAGGDVLSVPHVRKAIEALRGGQLINGYGPTENTTFTCCYRIEPSVTAERSIPIGRPISNTEVYLLDEARQPVPIGAVGELFTGGDGLALGYLNRPEATAEKFEPHGFSSQPGARLYRTGDLGRWLPDGAIEFLGRGDTQVKLRGFRVELGEIENALCGHHSIRESSVIALNTGELEKQLVAYVVGHAHNGTATAEELRSFLQGRLPDYMIPSVFMFLPELPLSANGKVDRQALPAPDQKSQTVGSHVVPQGEVEARLAQIWEEVLNVKPVGVTDKFFDLGGHSLLAVKLVARIEKAFEKKLPVSAVFQLPTVRQLAEVIRKDEALKLASSIVAIQPEGTRPPIFLVHGVGGGMFWGYTNLAQHLGKEQPVYAFNSRGMDGREEFQRIEDMAAQYVADLREFQPHGPYHLGGYCFGGNVAFEMARQLTALGERVALLALLNCTPPNSSYNRISWTPMFVLKFIRSLVYWIGYMFQWSPGQFREFVKWKFRRVKGLFTQWLKPARADGGIDVEDMVDLSGQPEDQRKLWRIHIQALMDYHPQSYSGHVTLFRSRGHQFLCSYDPHYGWTEFAQGGVTVKIVPGAHESILTEPHAAAVARELKQSLSESR